MRSRRILSLILSFCLIVERLCFVDLSHAALSILPGASQTSNQPAVSKKIHYVGNLYEKDLQNNRQTNHIYLGNTRVAVVENGDVFYYHGDHLGSTNVVTDEAGEVREIIEYAPFGETTQQDIAATGVENTHHYNGKEEDEESGLYYYGARYYNPEMGRFITPDTIVQSPVGDPQTLNRYAYTSNNPINRIDPDGHSWLDDIFKGLNKFFNNGVQWLEKVTNSEWSVNVEVGQTHQFQDAETLAKGTGQVSLAIVTQPWQVGIGVARWTHDPRFRILKNSSYDVFEGSAIEDFDNIFVNGILNSEKDAFENAEKANPYKAVKVAYNPMDGPLADVTEAILQKLFLTSSVDRQLANALVGHKGITLSGHSQGAIIASNTLLNLGLRNHRDVVNDVVFKNTQISQPRAYLSAAFAGINAQHLTYGSRIFDPSNVAGPNMNPMKFLSGLPGLYLPFGAEHHGIE